jgi:hypothetical protein
MLPDVLRSVVVLSAVVDRSPQQHPPLPKLMTEVVLVAAAPATTILEMGSSNKRRYVVHSQD